MRECRNGEAQVYIVDSTRGANPATCASVPSGRGFNRDGGERSSFVDTDVRRNASHSDSDVPPGLILSGADGDWSPLSAPGQRGK